MWVCARCLGVLLGVPLGGLLAALLLNQSVPTQVLARWAVGFGILGFADWGLQQWAGVRSTNARRVATGFLLGGGSAALGLLLAKAAWTAMI